ncbi:MAG: Asp-tRNA(Asn)/Glu-tRNA(Gln) amidotransferase subunit GatA [Planctomycetes bacterium]|nr:Asp-tRNA(Asn)/Glu-tRNA(Gln) amidotransferase subunit GatA [Planctomycetota bacterium]
MVSKIGVSEIRKMNMLELSAKLISKELSAREVTDDSLKSIEETDGKISAFITVCADEARKQAKVIDEKRARGENLGAMAGIPVALKDNICTRGVRTTAASKILGNFVPTYDAFVVERLKANGAIIVGKTNLDEFAMGSSTEHSAFFPTRNPWDLSRVPGGSSGGSTAAVAAMLVHGALGSETGGSIRQPASLCGVVGLKTTYGRISRYGLIAFGSSLDQIGPVGRTASCAAAMFRAACGYDASDSTSLNASVPSIDVCLKTDLRGKKIGVPKEYFTEGISREVEDSVRGALSWYESQGAEIVEVSLPHTEYGIACYYIIAMAEASSNLARYDGVHYGFRAQDAGKRDDVYFKSRTEGFGEEVKRRIMLGTFSLSAGYYDAYYSKGLKTRTLIKRDFSRAFEKVDVIMCPTSPFTAFELGAKVDDPLAMYLCDVYTVSANLAGIPAISLPCGFGAGNLPIGLQIVGPELSEPLLLAMANAFESDHDFCGRTPAALT